MATFQLRSNNGTVARVQTAPQRVFRVSGSPRGPQGTPGATGAQGVQGVPGATGPGVPNGGTTGQSLIKSSGVDQATTWGDRLADINGLITQGNHMYITGTGTSGDPYVLNSSLSSSLYYNVRDFGAAGTGAGDDTVAIQNAINQAFIDGGGTVFFPAGNYLITAALVLKARVNLMGVSRWGATITQDTASTRAIELEGGASNIDTGTVISNLSIVGSGGGTTSGIYLEASALWYITIMDTTVTGFGGNGLHVRGSVVSRFENITAANCGENGFYIDGSDSFVTSVTMIACFGLDNVLAGIRIEKANYTSLVSCAGDFNDVSYYIFDCLGVTMVSCGSEFPVSVGYKIEGELAYSSHSINLIGCYAYQTKGIGYLFTGYVDATMTGSIDIDPFAGSTYSLQVDANAKLVSTNNTFANPTNIAGTYTRLAETDGRSWLNKVNVTAIIDTNGNNVFVPQATASAVNYLTIINAATGGAPFVQADGTDTNVSLYLAAKGTGSIRLTNGNGDVMVGVDGTNKANFFNFVPSAAASALQLQAQGTDTNISFNIVPKGTGRLQAGGVTVPTISSTDTFSGKTIAAGSNTITGLAVTNFGGITGTPSSSTYLRGDGTWSTPSGGSGTVTSVSVTTANGVSGSVATSTTTPAITLTLGAITPTTVNGVTVSGSSTPTLAVTGTTAVSGTNTGDQTTVSGNAGTATVLATARTIGTLTGDVTSAGSSFDGSAVNTNATVLATVNSNVGSFGSATQVGTFTVNAKGLTTAAANVTITPAVGSITGLGTNIATALAATFNGSGAITGTTSPAFVTPTLGVATATSINKVTITAPTTSATLTLITGSSLITAGAFALTLTSTATSNATIPAGTNTLYSTKAASITSAQMLASMSDPTGTGASVFATSPTLVTPVLGAATATSITMSGAVQQLSLTATGAPANPTVLIVNDTTNSTGSVYVRDNTNFAFSGSLYTAEFVNGSDTGRGYHVKNAGTGNSLQIDDATTLLMRIASTGVIFPLQKATASAPAYVKGGIYFDTTLNKMRIGGASAWETVTST